MKLLKKLTAAALALLLTGAASVCSAAAANGYGGDVVFTSVIVTGIIGDADLDGQITILDATRIQRTLAGLYIDDGYRVEAFGDVNEDGLDITDATAIQRYLAGLPDISEVGTPVIIEFFDPVDPSQEDPSDPEGGGFRLNNYEQELAALINSTRAENGLPPLVIDAGLCQLARLKSQDMCDLNYFSHISPSYGTPFEMLSSFGVRYNTAGENIGLGYRTPQAMLNSWMSSEGHRENILSEEYTRFGVGYVADGSYWTQLFVG